MSKIIYGLTVALLFNLAVFGGHGRVIADITYDENVSGGSRNTPMRLVSYYDRHAATLDYLTARLQTIKIEGKLNGTQIQNIKADDPVMDSDGNYSITFTYDEVSGASNRTYTLADLYNPADIAKNSVLTRVQQVKESLSISGTKLSNLKVGDLQTVTGGFKVEMTFDTESGSNQKYHIDAYYDPKMIAYNNVEDQLMFIKFTGKLKTTELTNLKIGPINEVPGGYSADITFDEVNGSTNIKFNVDDFYDQKMLIKDYIHDRMMDIVYSQKIDGNGVTNVKIGEIIDDAKNGKFTATLTYGTSDKYVIDSYYDPVAKAINDLNNKITTLKNNMLINGTPIKNLKIGKIQVM